MPEEVPMHQLFPPSSTTKNTTGSGGLFSTSYDIRSCTTDSNGKLNSRLVLIIAISGLCVHAVHFLGVV